MSDLRAIDPSPYPIDERLKAQSVGPAPVLQWLPIAQLGINPDYQRDILRRGRDNVGRIARLFDWRKFGTVIVAPVAGGRYAIVDGQHRTTAAAVRGIESIPCQIIMADPGEQAAAFAAINGAVTGMTPLQLHAARVAAGDRDACEIARICERAGVSICRYPLPASKMVAGQTLALGAISQTLRTHGPAIAELTLAALRHGAGDVGGRISADFIHALAQALAEERAFRTNRSALLAAMGDFGFDKALDEAAADARRRKMRMRDALYAIVFDHLDTRLGDR
jgi:hypothetical protein